MPCLSESADRTYRLGQNGNQGPINIVDSNNDESSTNISPIQPGSNPESKRSPFMTTGEQSELVSERHDDLNFKATEVRKAAEPMNLSS